MNCAVYARKSTDDERRDGKSESVERQIENAKTFAVKQGWSVAPAHVYSDVAISGGDFDRPGLSGLLDALKAKKVPFERLVTMEQSRLGRDVARTLLLIKTIEDAGVHVWSYGDGRQITLLDESGENAVALRGIVDNGEKRRARRRTREGLAKKALAGYVIGAVPYGYAGVRVDDDHTEFRVNEVQAEVVRRVYTLYADALGGSRIVNTLRAEGAPAPGPKGWSKMTVRAMLNRPIYVGVVETRCSTGDAKQRGQNNVVRVETPHLRIVPEDLERRVRARQSAARATLIRGERGHLISKPEVSAVAKYLCNSIARCHVCGGPLVFINKGKRHTTASYYCGQRKYRGTAVCSNTAGVPVEGLDYAIRVKLYDMLDRDFDKVLDLCMEQAAVWRERQSMPKGSAGAAS